MWKLKRFVLLKWNLSVIIDDAVEEVVGFNAVEGALHVVKKFLVQRPHDVSSRIKTVQTLLKEVAFFVIEDIH